MPPKKTPKQKATKQKQKQRQSQRVVINLATPRKRTTKPRATARGGTSRVLSQFLLPERVLPDQRAMINPVFLPQNFVQQNVPQVANTFASRAPAVQRDAITGQTAVETPLARAPVIPRAVSDVMRSVSEVEALLGGSNTLLPPSPLVRSVAANAAEQRVRAAIAGEKAGRPAMSPIREGGASSSETDAPPPSNPLLRRASAPTDIDTDDEEFFGVSGGAKGSPSLVRR